MDEPNHWRHMSSAPKDGSRILVTVRSVEQGPAEVDVAYWSHGDSAGVEGWRAADSTPGRIVAYADPEIICWMPLPRANLAKPGAPMPSPFQGDEIEVDGSGI